SERMSARSSMARRYWRLILASSRFQSRTVTRGKQTSQGGRRPDRPVPARTLYHGRAEELAASHSLTRLSFHRLYATGRAAPVAFVCAVSNAFSSQKACADPCTSGPAIG